MSSQLEDVKRGHSSIIGCALFYFLLETGSVLFPKKNQNLIIASHVMEVSMWELIYHVRW